MLRSVDIQQILMQSNSVERVQQVQQQSADMQQRYFGVQLTEERKQAKEKINDSEEASKVKIGKEEKERQPNEGKKKNIIDGKSQEATEKEATMMDSEKGGRIDIRV